MIVKNEEKNLRNCLSKASMIVDEIVVIDTGSTDDTKVIAKEFTDNIYDFQWRNDFSEARNFSISKSRNDWILILDADEFIESFDKQNILEFITAEDNVKNVGRIKRVNVIQDSLGTKNGTERIARLFNKKYFYYEGIIHEQVVSIEKEYRTA
jgi:glycosyltransferase involved in cell wall biosynthesis